MPWHLGIPERAWLQVLGNDGVEVWVNGQNAGRSPRVGVGRAAGLVTNISTYLHKGHNAVAIHVMQLTIDRPPAVALDRPT